MCSFYCRLMKEVEPWKWLSDLPSEAWLLVDWWLIKKLSYVDSKILFLLKVRSWDLRQFLSTKSPLKIIKNAFHVSLLKALFVLEIFTFLFWLFGYVEKRLGKKARIDFKTYEKDVNYLHGQVSKDGKIWTWQEATVFKKKLLTVTWNRRLF